MEQISAPIRQDNNIKTLILKLGVLKFAALGGMPLLVALLWPIFTQAEASLAIIFVVLSMVGIGIAAMAMFSKRFWLLWAALGVWPGTIAGGLLFTGNRAVDGQQRHDRLGRRDRWGCNYFGRIRRRNRRCYHR